MKQNQNHHHHHKDLHNKQYDNLDQQQDQKQGPLVRKLSLVVQEHVKDIEDDEEMEKAEEDEVEVEKAAEDTDIHATEIKAEEDGINMF